MRDCIWNERRHEISTMNQLTACSAKKKRGVVVVRDISLGLRLARTVHSDNRQSLISYGTLSVFKT